MSCIAHSPPIVVIHAWPMLRVSGTDHFLVWYDGRYGDAGAHTFPRWAEQGEGCVQYVETFRYHIVPLPMAALQHRRSFTTKPTWASESEDNSRAHCHRRQKSMHCYWHPVVRSVQQAPAISLSTTAIYICSSYWSQCGHVHLWLSLYIKSYLQHIPALSQATFSRSDSVCRTRKQTHYCNMLFSHGFSLLHIVVTVTTATLRRALYLPPSLPSSTSIICITVPSIADSFKALYLCTARQRGASLVGEFGSNLCCLTPSHALYITSCSTDSRNVATRQYKSCHNHCHRGEGSLLPEQSVSFFYPNFRKSCWLIRPVFLSGSTGVRLCNWLLIFLRD